MFWRYGVEHIGHLCKELREARKIGVRELANASGCNQTSLYKFESGQTHLNSNNFKRLVLALQSDKTLPRRLSTQQGDLLHSLYRHSKDRHERQVEFQSLGFSLLADRNRSKQLAVLVKELEKIKYPAFIMDALWFIHAVNGALLRLFSINPDPTLKNSYLRRWEAWHVLATKFTVDSPVRLAHDNPELYFTYTVEQFFTTRYTARFLFTDQMNALLKATNNLSHPHKLKFDDYWQGVMTFTLDYEPRLVRNLYYKDDEGKSSTIQTESLARASYEVELGQGHDAVFTLAAWYPASDHDDTLRAFEEIDNYDERHKPFFAATYEREAKTHFHVNEWQKTN